MTVLPDHVQKIVAEIETEIGEEPGDAELAIEGAALRGHDGNGRVEAAVREILTEIGEDPDRQGLRRHAGPRPPDVHRADRRLPRRPGPAA